MCYLTKFIIQAADLVIQTQGVISVTYVPVPVCTGPEHIDLLVLIKFTATWHGKFGT